MTLLEKINHLNLKPRNAPVGVKVSTFGEWLRKLRAGQEIGEIPTALLTLYCDGRIAGGANLGSAENFPEKGVQFQNPSPEYFDGVKYSAYVDDEVCLIPPKGPSTQRMLQEKIPAKLPSATPTGFASWGTDKTMKVVGKVVKFNLNDLSYIVGFEKAKSGFLVDGKKCELSDFTEVK